MNSSKFEIQISNSNTHALCQVPIAKLYFHKEENERCTRQRESQSEYYYFMPWLIIWRVEDYMRKGQNCSDMTPQSPRTCPDLFFLILYFLYLLFLPRLQTKHLELNFFFFFQERQQKIHYTTFALSQQVDSHSGLTNLHPKLPIFVSSLSKLNYPNLLSQLKRHLLSS